MIARPYDWLARMWRRARGEPWAELLAAHGLPVPDDGALRDVLDGRIVEDGFTMGIGRRLGRRYGRVETLLGVLPVDQGRGTFWEPDPGGGAAVIQPVSSTGIPGERDVIDLLAWHPERPGEVRVLTGQAKWLGSPDWEPETGAWEPDPDGMTAPPLTVVATPREWLGRQDAICLLDWSGPVLRELAGHGRPLVFTDLGLADLFRDRVTAMLLPEILVDLPEAA